MASGDAKLLVALAAMAFLLWMVYFQRLRRLGALRSVKAPYVSLAVAPVLCLLISYVLLLQFAASDVRTSIGYVAFYLALGALVVGGAERLTTWMGVSIRDDVLERGNLAAAVTMSGGLVAITLCYLGGNFGDGPGWFVVLFCSALSIAGLFAVWAAVEMVSGISEAITVDRDVPTGLHMSGFLIASGLILGRAVAGDWVSVDATIHDFVSIGWPVVFWAAGEAAVALWSRAAKANPGLPTAALVAIVHVATASWYVVSRGWW